MSNPKDESQFSSPIAKNNSRSPFTNEKIMTNGNNQINHEEDQNSVLEIIIPPKKLTHVKREKISYTNNILVSLGISFLGLWFNNYWLGALGSIFAFFFSLITVIPAVQIWLTNFLTHQERQTLISFIGLSLASLILAYYLGIYQKLGFWLNQFKYDEFGSWAEWVGALGQISIAVLAVYVAWQQYVISKDLTIQQNRITQQQTIDTYFQGISDLVLGPDGLLEDWPQERAIAEGRTAAILSSVDDSGKAKILRFLSKSRLLTPLRRDSHLGRPILDGSGGYAEDRQGMRVINLGVVLAGSNLMGQDLRWVDLTDANMVRVNLNQSELVKANLSRTILFEAHLEQANLKGVRLFYGSCLTATPRDKRNQPDYETGENTGVVIEKANLTGVKNLSEENRYYCCCWGGKYTRSTIPGGCEGIPNKLEDGLNELTVDS